MAALQVGEGPIVSVQRRATADVVEGHLAWGWLLDHDAVVVPGPLRWLDQGELFDVLVASPADPSPVRRFSPRDVHVLGLARAPAGAVAVIRLDGAAGLGPLLDQGFDPTELGQRIDDGDDVWVALEQVGVVPAGVRDRRPEDVLPRVAELERRHRADLVHVGLVDRFSVVGWINPFCLFTPRCESSPG